MEYYGFHLTVSYGGCSATLLEEDVIVVNGPRLRATIILRDPVADVEHARVSLAQVVKDWERVHAHEGVSQYRTCRCGAQASYELVCYIDDPDIHPLATGRWWQSWGCPRCVAGGDREIDLAVTWDFRAPEFVAWLQA